MRLRESIARVFLALILIGLPAGVLGYQYWLRPALSPLRVVDIFAALPEAGGFRPNVIEVWVGETVTLRFTSTDVLHGVAFGPPLEIDLGQLDAGHTKELTLTFDRVGLYTFYCNIWSNPDSWRMRGVVDVRDPNNPDILPSSLPDPIIAALAAEGVNINAGPMRLNVPASSYTDGDSASGDDDEGAEDPLYPERPWLFNYRWPSAGRAMLIVDRMIIPAAVNTLTWRRSHTPLEAADLLAYTNPTFAREQVFDVVAYLWVRDLKVSETTLSLYNHNCAACHGQTGDADGPGSKFTVMRPVRFTDLSRMFDMRSDVLYAKIWQGGSGTNMPNFGPLFTPDEIWSVVDHIWELAVRD